MSKYQAVIGIEIHLELLTASKMFSRGRSQFNQEPNTDITYIDLALPGVLPVVNVEAVRQAVRMAHLLHCRIDDQLHFDRKNYFYHDLPKGFQITQERRPIGFDGWLEIDTPAGPKRIGITRAHLEEDTAKQIHQDGETLLDFNRAGIPLLEIVTDCSSFADASEVMKYLEKIRLLASHVGVSDARMEEGSMRCDVNISLRLPGGPLGTKVEVKNINSISNVGRALEYEIERQSQILDQGGTVVQETRRFDDQSRRTVFMRSKSNAVDYRYFPEANIFPIPLSREFIDSCIASIGRLPDEEMSILLEKGLLPAEASSVVENRELSRFVFSLSPESFRTAINLLLGDVAAYLNASGLALSATRLTPELLTQLAQALDRNEVSRKHVKTIVEEMVVNGSALPEIVARHGLVQISDDALLRDVAVAIVADFPDVVAQIRSGRDNAYQFLIGQMFKRTKGQASPELAARLIREEVAKVL